MTFGKHTTPHKTTLRTVEHLLKLQTIFGAIKFTVTSGNIYQCHIDHTCYGKTAVCGCESCKKINENNQ